MRKNVELVISGLHRENGIGHANVKTEAIVLYFRKNGSHYLIYQEAAEGFDRKTKTRIKFAENRLELVRQGPLATRMTFEKHKSHNISYNTPYGVFHFVAVTKQIRVDEAKDCIKVRVDYELESEGSKVSDSSIHICVKEKNA